MTQIAPEATDMQSLLPKTFKIKITTGGPNHFPNVSSFSLIILFATNLRAISIILNTVSIIVLDFLPFLNELVKDIKL